MINAKDAKKKSDQYISALYAEECKRCDRAIKEAAEAGQTCTSIDLDEDCDAKVLSTLTHHGFNVEPDEGEKNIYYISWERAGD